MNCILDMTKLEIEHRDKFIFYATHEMIIYKEGRYIVAQNCSGQTLAKVSLPSSYKSYEYLSFDDAVVLLFNGKTLVFVDKYGENSFTDNLPINRIGRSLLHIFPSSQENAIVFAAHLHNNIHFVHYDFITKKRIAQTLSWEVSQVNDARYEDGKIYALMDNTYMVCCDAETCETLWTKFETGHVSPKLLPFGDGVIYACQNLLKVHANKKTEVVRIPLARPNTVELIKGDLVYYTSNDQKHLCCFDLKNKKLIWEITGTEIIKKTISAVGKSDKNVNDMLLLQTDAAVTVINLSLGRVHSHFKLSGLQDIRRTDNHILIHRLDQTGMLPGVS